MASYAAVFAAVATCAASPTLPEQGVDARLDEATLIGSHNTFEHGAHLLDALDAGATAVELDLWDDGAVSLLGLGAAEQDGDWYVRHLGDMFHGGNINNCGGGNESLHACLDDLREWHEAHPQHGLVMVFLDKKQGWGATRMPRDLDTLLCTQTGGVWSEAGECFGAPLVTPAMLRGEAPTLRQAAQDGLLPRLSALRGRFMFVLTAVGLRRYVEERGAAAQAFVAPEIVPSQLRYDILDGMPPELSVRTQPWVIFYNMDYNELCSTEASAYDGLFAVGRAINQRHYLSRVYNVPEDLMRSRPHAALQDYSVVVVDGVEGLPPRRLLATRPAAAPGVLPRR